uniref:Uncharacterized protein n=1 Tax=Anopheles albimanus TaxID=7167 RepID=A0A182FDY2_ANOAL
MTYKLHVASSCNVQEYQSMTTWPPGTLGDPLAPEPPFRGAQRRREAIRNSYFRCPFCLQHIRCTAAQHFALPNRSDTFILGANMIMLWWCDVRAT